MFVKAVLSLQRLLTVFRPSRDFAALQFGLFFLNCRLFSNVEQPLLRLGSCPVRCQLPKLFAIMWGTSGLALQW